MNTTPLPEDILAASERIHTYIHKTPVLTSESLNNISGAKIYFKCENFQKVGAFKARGGLNTILSLSEKERNRGVATHSSGNHAQAVALAAREIGIEAHIVMPSDSPEVKKAAVRGYGANLIECEPTLASREKTLEKIIEKTGAVLVHPYDDYRIIAGQATAAKELIESIDMPLDYLLTPVSGGGLLSGTALSTHYWSPTTKVVGCEPSGADDAYRSLKADKLIPQLHPQTIADGLRASLGSKPFGIIREHVSDILLADDDDIIRAMRIIWERMKIIVEPSGAIPVAVLLNNKEKFEGKRIGIILSGGNVELSNLPFK